MGNTRTPSVLIVARNETGEIFSAPIYKRDEHALEKTMGHIAAWLTEEKIYRNEYGNKEKQKNPQGNTIVSAIKTAARHSDAFYTLWPTYRDENERIPYRTDNHPSPLHIEAAKAPVDIDDLLSKLEIGYGTIAWSKEEDPYAKVINKEQKGAIRLTNRLSSRELIGLIADSSEFLSKNPIPEDTPAILIDQKTVRYRSQDPSLRKTGPLFPSPSNWQQIQIYRNWK